MAATKLKQSLYFPEQMLEEIRVEAERLNRSLSWVVHRAWKAAHREMLSIPSANDVAAARAASARDPSDGAR